MHFHVRTRGVSSGFTGPPLNPIALRSGIARDWTILDPPGVEGDCIITQGGQEYSWDTLFTWTVVI